MVFHVASGLTYPPNCVPVLKTEEKPDGWQCADHTSLLNATVAYLFLQ